MTAQGLPEDDPSDTIDDSEPACDTHLNPPQGEPRLRLLSGGVWW